VSAVGNATALRPRVLVGFDVNGRRCTGSWQLTDFAATGDVSVAIVGVSTVHYIIGDICCSPKRISRLPDCSLL
jgi:hypothetical protein